MPLNVSFRQQAFLAHIELANMKKICHLGKGLRQQASLYADVMEEKNQRSFKKFMNKTVYHIEKSEKRGDVRLQYNVAFKNILG